MQPSTCTCSSVLRLTTGKLYSFYFPVSVRSLGANPRPSPTHLICNNSPCIQKGNNLLKVSWQPILPGDSSIVGNNYSPLPAGIDTLSPSVHAWIHNFSEGSSGYQKLCITLLGLWPSHCPHQWGQGMGSRGWSVHLHKPDFLNFEHGFISNKLIKLCAIEMLTD